MKTQRRTVPMDCLHVRKGNKTVILSTHRNAISLATYSGNGLKQEAWHEFTFDQLYNFLTNLRDGVGELNDHLAALAERRKGRL